MSRSQSPTDKQDEHQKENPEITEKSKMQMDQNGGPLKSYEEEDRKGDVRESMNGRKNSRSQSFQSNDRMGRGRVGRSPDSAGSRSPRQRRRSDSRSRGGMSPRSKPDDAEFTQIYVAGISRSTTADDLEKVFEQIGPIRDIVMKNKYAFIDYKHH